MSHAVPLFRIAAFCGRGSLRPNNEDGVSVDGQRLVEEKLTTFAVSSGPHLFLVSDGMGGHASGSVASGATLEFLGKEWEAGGRTIDAIDALRRCNRYIFEAGQERPEYRGMGCTVAGLAVVGETASWFNVGDSKVYRSRGGVLQQLSKDHVVEASKGGGRRRSHAITQSIGGGFSAVEVWPFVGGSELCERDIFLICSDGVTDVISDEFLESALIAELPLDERLRALVEAVVGGGAPDNLSAVIIEFDGRGNRGS